MGSNCTSCKKPSSTYKNKKNSKNNIEKGKSFTNSENKTNILNALRNYKFFKNTKNKNDYFIECDLLLINTEEIGNVAKYLEKWVLMISLSRTEKKVSYQNLISEKEKDLKNFDTKIKTNNFNRNYLFSNKKQIESKERFSNTNCVNNDENKDNNDNNIISTTNNCEIKIYSGRDKYFSDLVMKLQIALMYNKDRFIKYLSKGPPNNLRWAIWLTIALTDPSSKFLTQSEYSNLVSKSDSDFQQNYEDQIKKDIKRSNIGLEFLTEKSAEESLYRILKALAISDPELGYCQGMNIIAANLLILSDSNELESFNLMLYFLNNLELREFFLNGFPKLLMFIFIFREFIKDQYPLIHAKLEFLDIPEELWVFKWLQTLFFLALPLSVSVRLMDCILCFGLEFLLNFSLSFVKENEAKIMHCQSMESFIELFKGPEIDEEEESTEDNKTNEYYYGNEKNGKFGNTAVNLVRNLNCENKKDIDDDKFNKENNLGCNDENRNINGNEANDNSDHKDLKIGFKEKNEKENGYSNQTNAIPNANAQRKLSYFKNFDFSKDIISYREKLIREAKSLCIRDLIDKMIETYSQNNYNPLFNFNPNNVLNTLNNQDVKSNHDTRNNYYDYQKTVNFEEDNNFYAGAQSERTVSAASSPRNATSLSYSRTSKSINEELSEYKDDSEINEEEKNIIKEENEFGSKNEYDKSNKDVVEENVSMYSNNDLDKKNINDEIPCRVNKRRNIRLTRENIVKDFGERKSIMFNIKSNHPENEMNHSNEINNNNNNNNNNKQRHFSNLNYKPKSFKSNRTSNFNNFGHSKEIFLSYIDRGKSVRFDVSASSDFFNKYNSNNSNTNHLQNINKSEANLNNLNDCTNKLNQQDIFEFSLPHKAFNNTTNPNNNIYQNTEENASLYTNENLANTYNDNTERGCTQNNNLQLQKVSDTGNTNHTIINNQRGSKRFFKPCVRQSLNLNFGRRLNIEQIMMMNKIKSKMSVIQSMNKSEGKKNLAEKQSSVTSNLNVNLNLSSGLNFKESKNKSENAENANENNSIKNYFLNENRVVEEKKTMQSEHVLSTSERKNTMNSDSNLNNYVYQKNDPMKFARPGLSRIQTGDKEITFNTEPHLDSKKFNEFNLNDKRSNNNNFSSVPCESEDSGMNKKRHTSMPFSFQSPLNKIADSKISSYYINNHNNDFNGKSNKNVISPFNFKIQKDFIAENSSNLDSYNNNENKSKNAGEFNNKEKAEFYLNNNPYKIRKNGNYDIQNNNHKENGFNYNFNDIIIEEEHGLGNVEDD